jgi:hypothetical protein
MGIRKNIGKNTIGDNNKMSVSLHDYSMSTHDLSTIVRNTQSPGTLVPNLCLVAQKGDTFDIDIDSNVLTHPTTGPLFGSFKLEHHIYTGPVRLYNSWLHNNRTKIGLNMEQVKLPQIKVNIRTLSDTPSNEEKQWIQVNPSCLLAYLGIRGYANTPNSGEGIINKNALPILTYFDIFKNYYANTQEENFYMIGTSPKLTTTINGIDITNLDTIRDKILLTPGDTVFDISNENMSVAPLTNFAKRTAQGNLNTSFLLYILLLYTTFALLVLSLLLGSICLRLFLCPLVGPLLVFVLLRLMMFLL